MKIIVKIFVLALTALTLGSAFGQVTTVPTAPLKLIEPYAIAVDYASGTYYISDGVQDRIVKHTPPLGTVPAKNTSFTSTFNPTGIAIGNRVGLGRGLILAGSDHRIHFLDLTTAADTVIAGSSPGYADNANGLSAQFLSPQGIAIAADGTIYVADVQNNRVRRIANTPQATVTTVAPSIRFRTPVAVTLNDSGSLFVADNGNNSVKIINLSNGDQLSGEFSVEGPRGMVWIGGDTGLLVAETPHNVIRQFLGTGGFPSIFAGKLDEVGQVDSAFETSTFNAPAGLAIDGDGNILVADTANNALRALIRPATAPLKVLNTFEVPAVSGAYSNSFGLFVSNESPGTTFRYTTDGTIPTVLSSVFDSGHVVDGGSATASPAIVQIRGFNPDLTASAVISNSFAFFVAPPRMSPAGATNNDTVTVRLDTDTAGAKFSYTTDGSDPTLSNGIQQASGVPFTLTASGLLKARAFKTGYTNSDIITNIFLLQVSDPIISPNGASSGSPVLVRVSSATPNASIYWTLDGSTPSPTNGTLQASGSTFVVNSNSTLRVAAYRTGFTPSQVVSASFDLHVDAPDAVVAPVSGGTSGINKATISLTDGTTNATIKYTLDGSSPVNGTPYTAPFTIDTNATLRAIGVFPGFTSSSEITNSINIKADAPVMSPAGGVFQDGTILTLTVQRTNGSAFSTSSSIYYTFNGVDPTPNDTLYTGPVRLSWLNFQTTDLRQIRARAFAPGTSPSDVVSGTVVTNNTVGIPRDVHAGIGATVFIPVTVSLKQGTQLRSLQYRVQVWPVTPGAPNLKSGALSVQSFSTNSFVPIIGNQSGTATNITTDLGQTGTSGGVLTNELSIAFIGNGSNLRVTDFATINMLALELPGTARTNDAYAIRIRQVSGTSDAEQNAVPLSAGADRQIVIKNITYLVGDSAPGGWYNAGDFGDNNLDNSDVNNAFYASVGLKVPYRFSDLFDAMDAFPVDTASARGGDGIIRFLDWTTILDRSLRVSATNWRRSWTSGGVVAATSATLGASGLQSPLSAADELTPLPPGLVWFREAVLSGSEIEHVSPGASVSVPVNISIAPHHQISGLMFRAIVEAVGAAPELNAQASFVAAAGLPGPTITAAGLPLNELAIGWNVSSFNPPLTGRQLIGQIRFTIPLTATAHQVYRVRFSTVDGAPDLGHEYNFESHPGLVFVQDENHQPVDPITDEWRTKFFGSTTNPDADAMADPDGDHIPNWQEFLAGTDPTNPDSKLELHRPGLHPDHKGLSISWLTAPGKTYVVETATSIDATVWTVVATGIAGDGNFHEIVDALRTEGAFYRIRLQDQP
jgi:sugar lactone lactonase YvrE